MRFSFIRKAYRGVAKDIKESFESQGEKNYFSGSAVKGLPIPLPLTTDHGRLISVFSLFSFF
jgi:hypothetical protein